LTGLRWLLLKDLRILRRSPLLVGLLVLYPIVIAVLIGFALSRGPDKPEVAFYNGLPESAATIELGGQEIDLTEEGSRLFEEIDPVPVDSRREAIQKVRDGDVLGALIIPEDLASKLQSTLQPATVEVYYNAEDPAKKEFVENTIEAQVQRANAALTKRIAVEALDLLDLISDGGSYSFLGQDFDVLGLVRAERILSEARDQLPADSPQREQLDRVIAFGQLARENLAFSDEVLGVVGEPIRVKAEALEGGSTSLSAFAVALAAAVSLMFVTLLLAAGLLAIEREENAFARLVRGLVSETALLAEKAGLAAACSAAVCMLMLAGLGLFVELDWGRLPLWLLAVVAGALAFAALGLAIGALTREVRAASLLAFMLALPLAFLALVPSGAVAPALFDVIRAVSAAFPFKPTLDALDAALNDAGGLAGPLVHLGVLVLVFGALSRLGLRRFAEGAP
jgi:ABC-type multidrug transport system permease subunit